MAVGDEDVEPAVVVEIEESAAEAEYIPCRNRDARLSADLGEKAFAIVVPDVVRGKLEIGDVEIKVAVIVVVAQRHAHGCHSAPVFGVRHAARQSDLAEGAIAL